MLSPQTVAASAKTVRLTHDFEFHTRYGSFVAPKGFEYDGSSSPRTAQFLLRLNRFDPRLRAPACAHDYLYQTGLLTKKQADQVYCDLMRANGVDKVRSWLHHSSLRLMGWIAWQKHRKIRAHKLKNQNRYDN